MNKKTIEKIKTIAGFMGWEKSPYPNLPNKMYRNNLTKGISIDQFEYHKSWNALMPVVEKIETLFNDGILVIIKDQRCYIEVDTQRALVEEIIIPENFYSGFSDTKFKAVYSTVTEFLAWYNSRPKTKTNEQTN